MVENQLDLFGHSRRGYALDEDCAFYKIVDASEFDCESDGHTDCKACVNFRIKIEYDGYCFFITQKELALLEMLLYLMAVKYLSL